VKPERWRQIDKICSDALRRPPAGRSGFIDEACAEDPSLRQEVEAVLGSVDGDDSFLNSPAIDVLANAFESSKPGAFADRTFGPYKTTMLLGAGGMGEVYLADDTRLGRKVALKLLAPRLLKDPHSRALFLREARSVSRLNHPHICVLHDIGQQDGIDYLVMEYLEGETLAARLKRGALPPDQALRYAIDIAEALDKAHRQGVTHRDLKPGNIMLTKSGAKLLDFGLAKIGRPFSVEAAEAEGNTAEPSSLSGRGSIRGTLQYMSPEQLDGKEVDARTDIFAFGAVLYETLTGRKAFDGPSQSSVIAAIMHVDPPAVSSLQPITPRVIDRVVRICLTKDPDERWQTAHDLKLQLQAIADEGPQPGILAPTTPPLKNRKRLWKGVWAVTGVLVLGLAIGLTLQFRKPAPGQPSRFFIDASQMGNAPHDITVSPDGLTVAYVGFTPSGSVLYARPIDSLDARQLPGTEGAVHPFWSPDSRYIAFGGTGKLMKVPAAGGSPQYLCPLSNFMGGAWNSNDVIVFSDLDADRKGNVVYQITAAGGKPAAITKFDESRQETAHFWPAFLPDGRHYLYFALTNPPERSVIVAGSLESSEKTLIMPSVSKAVYSAPGYLLFGQDRTLVAQPFDAKRLQRTGEPVPVADDLLVNGPHGIGGRAAFDVSSGSENNVLVYRTQTQKLKLDLMDRSGLTETIGVPPFGFLGPDLSPDGKRLAIHKHEGSGGNIWVIELSSSRASQLTFDASQENSSPIWSPDGSHIAFGSHRNGKWGIYQKASDGSGKEDLLYEDALAKMPTSWSKNYILYWASPTLERVTGQTWALRLADHKATPLFNDHISRFAPQLSPDEKLFAYMSDEGGPYQVYVALFPAGSGKVPVSKTAGYYPRWSSSQELFFMDRSNAGNMMSSQVRSTGTKPEATAPVLLFPTTFSNNIEGHRTTFHAFAVFGDGRRFLVPQNPMVNPPITVVVNWQASLKK
jgi:serine/threonine protein kinase/Tol biopolymer transport system component